MYFQNFQSHKVHLSANFLLKPCIAVDLPLEKSHLKNLQKKESKVEKFAGQITLCRYSDLTELEGVRAEKFLSLNNKTLTIYTENNPMKSELCTVFQSNGAASLMEIMCSQYSTSSLQSYFYSIFKPRNTDRMLLVSQ